MAAIYMATTEIDPIKTAGQIQAVLVKAGATSISMQYEGAEVQAIRFAIDVGGEERWFCLPVNTEAVFQILRGDGYKSYERVERIRAQAKRTAWRHVLRWVQAQVAMIQTSQVEVAQVFLPYMLVGDDGRTMFEMVESRMLALPAGGQE